ncbi:hypothetical protein [Comamonas sp. JC664]|uniref:hypothetical protein n=1 Tax=Comamonas sp. JC664 TaxID=2801917 RepID=UPI0017482102|nr:hypothetical protein [Comamonas sp. JC664]MBL0695475.1 hypothetical protein [Comamonas sp. JC664]GHG88208.1 hypothetical protein GCM10012319_46800 [Comamonas sp. KCTC 72670]
MVSLWDMLCMMTVATSLGGATSSAQLAGGGIIRYGIGVLLGVGLGLLSMAAMRRAGHLVFRSLPPGDATEKSPVRLTLIYVAAGVWLMGPSPALSLWLTGYVLRTAFP